MAFAAPTLCCFADMPGWGYYGPLAGSFLLVCCFLAIGITFGGIWLVRLLRSRPVAGAHRWSLRALGGAAWSAAIVSSIIGMELHELWIVAVGLVAMGSLLLWSARNDSLPTTRSTNTQEQSLHSPNLEPVSVPVRIPDWADSYYLPKFRDVGRREPERRQVIMVTPAAVARIRSTAAGTGAWYVRARVEVFRDAGEMPTGFKNRVEVVTDIYPEFDLIDDSQGVPVVVDRRSAEFLGGNTLDWVEGEDSRSGFRLE